MSPEFGLPAEVGRSSEFLRDASGQFGQRSGRIPRQGAPEFGVPAGRTGHAASAVAFAGDTEGRHDGYADRRGRHLPRLPVPGSRLPHHLGVCRRVFARFHRPAAVRAQRDGQLSHPPQLIG